MSELKKIIEEAFENRDQINAQTKGEIRDSVDETLNQLDTGLIRVCEKNGNDWIVNQWIKKAILLSFRLNDNEIIKASHATWYDKVPSKTVNWSKKDHEKAGFRYVPDAVVRKSAYIAKNLVPAKKVGFTSVWIDAGYENFSDDIQSSKQFLDHETTNITDFLENINKGNI